MRSIKKEENNISTMKTHQMPNKWQYLTCTKVSFSNPDCNMSMRVASLYIIIKLIWTIFAYNHICPSLLEKLHINCIKECIQI